MKKILYALTGVSMLALTAQVSAMAVTTTNSGENEGGSYSQGEDTRKLEIDGKVVGSDTNKHQGDSTYQNRWSNKNTGDFPDGPPFVGPGGEPSIEGGGPVELVRLDGGGDY